MEFDSGLYKIGNPLTPHDKELVKTYPLHVRVFTLYGLIQLAKFLGFKIEKIKGSGHIFGNFGELINKKRCRFIILKLRKK